MKLSSATVNAADVMSIAINPQPRAGVWFLNWAIRAKDIGQRVIPTSNVTAGSGLYGLCFDSKLIYVGSYLGKHKGNDNLFVGDVVKDRFWTHVGAITARGDRVHIAPRSLAALIQQLGSHHVMTAGFLAANNPFLLHHNAGNLAPLQRLLFSAAHQHVFLSQNANPADVLARFTFVYVRFDSMPQGMNSQSLAEHIETAEKGLIGRLSPCCNTDHLINGVPQSDVSCVRVEGLLREALELRTPTSGGAQHIGNQHSNPNEQEIRRFPTPEEILQGVERAISIRAPRVEPDSNEEIPSPEDTPAESTKEITPVDGIATQVGDENAGRLFWDRLPQDPHPSRTVVDSLVGLAMRLGVEVVYTKTNSGDIRFRTNTIRGAARIFMTLYWQPRLQRFIVQSQCSTEQAVVFMGPLEAAESVAETPENEPQLSRIEALAQISRTNALRQVFFQALQNVQHL